MRTAWPYVRDSISRQAVQNQTPFPVATCWNGAVVLKAEPFLYRPAVLESDKRNGDGLESRSREWRMIDNSEHIQSPKEEVSS